MAAAGLRNYDCWNSSQIFHRSILPHTIQLQLKKQLVHFAHQFSSMMNAMITDTVLLFIAAIVSLGAPQATQPALEPPECPLETQISFSLTLPNARVCASSIGAVLTPLNVPLTSERRSALIKDLDNVCIDSCGGMFADFLASENCNDTLGAVTLEVFCTPTNGGAAIGPYCRFASGDLDQTIFNAILACDNATTCASGCRSALIELKSQIGCCYQNLYNNTEYLTELMNTQFIPQFAFDRLQLLNDPLGNPWDACNVNAPQECTAEPFGCNTCRMNSICKASTECESSSDTRIQVYSTMILTTSLLMALALLLN